MKDFSQGEVTKACSRIGKTSEDVMKWVLQFAKLDLSQISEGDWLNLQYELFAFQIRGLKKSGPQSGGVAYIDSQEGDDVIANMFPLRQDVRISQKMLSSGVNCILNAKTFTLTFQALKIQLVPDDVVKGKVGSWQVYTHSQDVASVIEYNLFFLLREFASRIRCCPECHIFFLADRKNQFYCSAKHRGYSAVRNYRQSKGLITGRKRGRPRKQDTSKKRGVA